MPFEFDKLTASGFSGNIILPGDDRWINATQPWGAQSKRSPRLSLQPRTARDVAKAVSSPHNVWYCGLDLITQIMWLNDCGLDFAIRSGGWLSPSQMGRSSTCPY
jgi:hypothetical protein